MKKVNLTEEEENQILQQVRQAEWTKELFAKYYGITVEEVTDQMVWIANEMYL